MSYSSNTAASSKLVAMAADGSATEAAGDSDAVADGGVEECDSDTTAGGTVIKAARSDSEVVAVGL